jgi:hypothetical protein
MSFKALNDRVKQKALPGFLHAANLLEGVLVVVLVHKRVGSLFSRTRKFDFASVPEFKEYGSQAFERMLRAIHFLSLFVNGLSRPGQDLFWFTDADDFVATETRTKILTRLFAEICSHYLSHDLRHFRCGSSAVTDNGTLQVEDMCAICDLAAGATAQLFNHYLEANTSPNSAVIVPPPSTLSAKSSILSSWLAHPTTLRRLILRLDAESDGKEITVAQVTLHP